MTRRFASLLLAAALLPAGCAVGPNYRPPKIAVPAEYGAVGSAGTTNTAAELSRWWRTFNDPMLNTLIERAANANYSLKAASARLRAGRALRGAALADFLPTVDANGSFTVARRSENALSFPVRLIDTETYQAGFDASWELDVFGGRRRALESATAELQALEEDHRSVWVSVIAEVARTYVELRGTQERLRISKENIRAQEETFGITRQRFDAGLASDLEVTQASAVLATTRSQSPSLEASEQDSIHRLSLLMGEPPNALKTELLQAAAIPPVPPDVPAGLPADLLRRRPDVRRTERQLAAATARIGIAKAELFPKFSLTGVVGLQSLKTANLFSPASEFWTAGPSVRWRLLEYPRLRAQIKAETAQQEQMLAEFHYTVLSSLEEVENALVHYAKEKERLVLLDEQGKAQRRALDLATQVYQGGLGEFLNVLDAERSLYQTQDAQALSQQNVTLNLVALYKALGGGWEAAGTDR